MSCAPKIAPKRFATKAQWAKSKSDELYAQIEALKALPFKSDIDYRRRRDTIATLQREASRFLSMSFRYEERGQ